MNIKIDYSKIFLKNVLFLLQDVFLLGDPVKCFPFYFKASSLEDTVKVLDVEIQNKFKDLFSSFEIEEPQESGPTFSQNLIDMMKLFSEATYSVGFLFLNMYL